MAGTLRWFGCTTFLLEVDGLALLLDGYTTRVPAAPPLPSLEDALERLDAVLVGHSHAHHLADVPRLALRTGAPVVCHATAAAELGVAGVPAAQIQVVAGGERIRLGPSVTVRTYPSVHACDWMPPDADPLALRGSDDDERARLNAGGRRLEALVAGGALGAADVAQHLEASAGTTWHGGVIAYLVEWSDGSLLFADSIGAWSGVLRGLRPQTAVLSAAGVPNLDGDPFEGSAAEFVGLEAELLGHPLVVPCHHDDWMPPFTTPSEGRERALAAAFEASPSRLLLPRYGEPIALP